MNYSCPDCGPAPINHKQQYFSIFLDWLLSPFNEILLAIRRDIIAPVLLPLKLDRLALPIFRLLTKLKVGTINQSLDSQSSLRAKALLESADKLGIKIYEFRLFGKPLETYVAEYHGKYKFFYEIPRPSKPLSPGFWWMDNKPTMRKQFKKSGIPVALGGMAFTFSKATKIFEQIEGEVIVKPSQGSRSRHTTVHITSKEVLRKAFDSAKQISPFVLVEQELKGPIFRASVIGGRLAGVLSRNQPNVTGDGHSSLLQLVQRENQNPKRHNTVIFQEIPLDQIINPNAIPKFGEVIFLSDKVSRGVGATTHDCTDTTHPDNKLLFEKVARVLGDDCVGIDFIIQDITKSWTGQNLCGVIECNSAPFLDLHHYPFEGKSRDVCAMLWRLIFPIPA